MGHFLQRWHIPNLGTANNTVSSIKAISWFYQITRNLHLNGFLRLLLLSVFFFVLFDLYCYFWSRYWEMFLLWDVLLIITLFVGKTPAG